MCTNTLFIYSVDKWPVHLLDKTACLERPSVSSGTCASSQNRSYWDSSALLWIPENTIALAWTSAREDSCHQLEGKVSCLNECEQIPSSSTQFTNGLFICWGRQLVLSARACLRELARHLKTDPWDSSTLFWIPEKTNMLFICKAKTCLRPKALWSGASFENRSYWDRSFLFWIRKDTVPSSWRRARLPSRWTGHMFIVFELKKTSVLFICKTKSRLRPKTLWPGASFQNRS
jgi:hypothetical protein